MLFHVSVFNKCTTQVHVVPPIRSKWQLHSWPGKWQQSQKLSFKYCYKHSAIHQIQISTSPHMKYISRNIHSLVFVVILLWFGLYMYHCVIKWKYFRITGPLWGESTCYRWIPLTKISDAERWSVFFDLCLKKTIEQTIETPVIWDAVTLIMQSL